MMQGKNYNALLVAIIFISQFVRFLTASTIELGNDEVYYRILAEHLQLSYFDHPPATAILVSVSTLMGSLYDEILVRLFPLMIGSINTYLIYLIAKNPLFRLTRDGGGESNDNRRGIYAALLYSASLYATVICGIFIMPDAPLSLFWLLTLLCFVKILPPNAPYKHSTMLLAGLFIGLAMLSKYTGAYLWGACGLYILLYNRSLLKKWSLYVAALLSILVFSPVLIWNYLNDFISFTFHGGRVVGGGGIEPLFFARELFGSFFYNGIFNITVYFLAFRFIFLRLRKNPNRDANSASAVRLILCFSVPFIILFLGISLFKATLPHWSAPGYFALMILGASYLSSIKIKIARRWAKTLIISTLSVLTLAHAQINFGLIPLSANGGDPKELGRDDVTLDMYGWEELEEGFMELYNSDIEQGKMPAEGSDLLSFVWYEGAHIDNYVALPNNLTLKILGDIERTHFYDSVNEWRGGIDLRNSAYFIISSRSFNRELSAFEELQISPEAVDAMIPITRNGDVVQYFLIYRLNPLR